METFMPIESNMSSLLTLVTPNNGGTLNWQPKPSLASIYTDPPKYIWFRLGLGVLQTWNGRIPPHLRSSCVKNSVLVEHSSANPLLVANRHMLLPQLWYPISIISWLLTKLLLKYLCIEPCNYTLTTIIAASLYLSPGVCGSSETVVYK